MQFMQLRHNAVVARYDKVRLPFSDAAAQAVERTNTAIAPGILDSRNALKRVAGRINGADAASIANEGDCQAR
jgi:hypothetical protein